MFIIRLLIFYCSAAPNEELAELQHAEASDSSMALSRELSRCDEKRRLGTGAWATSTKYE